MEVLGYFGHFSGSRVILIIFKVLGYFNQFGVFKGILVILEASFSNPRDAVPGFVFGFGKFEASTLELELELEKITKKS